LRCGSVCAMSKSRCRLFRCALFVALIALAFDWLIPRSVVAASRAPALSRNGMVATSQVDATLAGVEMLAAGGNAIDAAVASAFAVGVTQPFSTGIGGGAFILLRLADGKVVAIDGRETAPGAADRDMFVRPGVAEDASSYGALAVGTPGMVAGLALALERYGTLTLAEVMAPAIRLARDGFAISAYHVDMMAWKRPRLEGRFPETLRIHYPRASRVGGSCRRTSRARSSRLPGMGRALSTRARSRGRSRPASRKAAA
jgi:gamma-glutamyltranspeptidase/glutathione hydrolase